MKPIRRIVSLVALGSLLWVAGAGLFHGHSSVQRDTHCTVCHAMDQTPALDHSPRIVPAELLVEHVSLLSLPVTAALASFPSSGRSPPAL